MNTSETAVTLMAFHFAKRRLIVAIEAGEAIGVDVSRLEALLRTNREESSKYLNSRPAPL